MEAVVAALAFLALALIVSLLIAITIHHGRKKKAHLLMNRPRIGFHPPHDGSADGPVDLRSQRLRPN